MQIKARVEEVISILLYGSVALVIGGGAGIYVPMFQGKEPGVDLFATYVFAILAPAFLDALFETYWRDFRLIQKMALGFIGAFAAALAGVALLSEHHPWSMKAALIASGLVLVVWFAMTLASGRFRGSHPPPKGSIGGADPTAANLSGAGLS